jgi:methyl-accepting chemotaxis protein
MFRKALTGATPWIALFGGSLVGLVVGLWTENAFAAAAGAAISLAFAFLAAARSPGDTIEAERLRGEAEEQRRDLGKLRDQLQESEASTRRVKDDLQRIKTELDTARRERDQARGEIEQHRNKASESTSEARRAGRDVAGLLETALKGLARGVQEQLTAAESTATSMRDMAGAYQDIAQHVEALASSAEESSSSILEMTATNDEVAENMANLAASVRETVSSIEEMAYSIKEVARNVDALSLTAEETSSSMNQMDVSIDQVQSNANETARLSEEVASDAELGADAILKTIAEINRIRETSGEAVAVISNLGSRIEAIGDILNVIDDVAEQTNLLALNAAIIAAQAGEHGKGFAVVADEIKDLAERAGASTKEIAELIKTIQAESKNAISAVERGAATVDRGVQVSADAERALMKIQQSSQKSTSMVRAIARATVEQAKGSKQVTDAIGRIAETVQQIAAATAEQARGSELIMKSAEKMRLITQHVERSSQEQARGGRQISEAIETISNMVNQLHQAQRQQARGSEQTLASAVRIQELARAGDEHLRALENASQRLRDLGNGG